MVTAAQLEMDKNGCLDYTMGGILCPTPVAFVKGQQGGDHEGGAQAAAGTRQCFQERTRIGIGDTVLVVGPGRMGIPAVQFAKLAGARQVILSGRSTDAERLEVGRKVGADVAATTDEDPVQAVMDLTGGRGADYVAECSGTESGLQQALDAARAKTEGRGGLGTVCLAAMYGRPVTLSLDRAPMGQLNLIGSWSWSGSETFERAIDLLHLGRIDYRTMITSRYALEEWEVAFANLRACRDVKALIHPNGTDWEACGLPGQQVHEATGA